MSTFDETPQFNIKVVVQATDIKPHTLRAWERRYNLPCPERSEAGQRLYSQRDIEIVKWLITKQHEGMTISRAVDLWFEMEKRGEDPLLHTVYSGTENESESIPDSILAEMCTQWVNSCLKFDERTAKRVLNQTFAIFPINTVCQEVLQKGLVAIGEKWAARAATVQQEHFASALAEKQLQALFSAAPEPNRIGRILVTCPPQEKHALPLLILAMMLRYAGWDVVYLGADVPLEQLEETADTIKPDLVITGAQQLYTAATLMDMCLALHHKGVRTGFGGAVFNTVPALRARIPGHFLGHTLEEGLQSVTQIMTFNPAAPATEPPAQAFKQALAAYHASLPLIESEVWQEIRGADIAFEHISDTNTLLANMVTAGLKLGNINRVDAYREHIRALLSSQPLSELHRDNYLNAYYRAAQRHLQEGDSPLLQWLESTVDA